VAVVRPLHELDLGDELRLDPEDVALLDAGHLRHGPEGRSVALERLQLLQEPIDLTVVEARADVAGVDELAALVGGQHERPERALTPALSARVAGEHELLPPVALDLHPLPRAPPREVLRAQALGHDPFEPLLLGGPEQRVPVVEGLGEAHDPVPLVEELFEPLAALLERKVDERFALDLEHVEDVVDDRRPRLGLLHRREARPALLVEGADLAVDDALGSLERFHELPRHVFEALAVVLVLPRAQLGVAAGDRRHDPVAVPLDLVDPVALRHRVGGRCEHRPVAARLASLRRGIVLLAQDQPVLRVARELRRHQRIRTLETVAVEADREAAVLLLLHQLVRALVPDLDCAGTVFALRNLALEGRVLERVVLDMDGQVLLPRLERRSFRHGPAGQRAVPLQAEVVVQAPRVVPLDDEDRLLPALLGAEGLGSLLGVALLLVFGELGLRHRV
jgi:hypothetical protein